MKFSKLKLGEVYFLPVRILKLLPVQERIKICEEYDEKTGQKTIEEEAQAGFPFPPYVQLWDNRRLHIGEDTYTHFLTAQQVADYFRHKMAQDSNPQTCKENADFLT